MSNLICGIYAVGGKWIIVMPQNMSCDYWNIIFEWKILPRNQEKKWIRKIFRIHGEENNMAKSK